jgi:hypothetical protein
MWQCRRCDSELDETPRCPRCPCPFDLGAIERASTSALMDRARGDRDAEQSTAIVAAGVVGLRYTDWVGSKGSRHVRHEVDLLIAGRPAKTFAFRRQWAFRDATPDAALLGKIVIVFLRQDTVVEWWPLEPIVQPPPEPRVGPDFPQARVVGASSVGVPPERFPPTTLPKIPTGKAPLTTQAGALVGLPPETLRPRVAAATTHPDLARAMVAPLPRTLTLGAGDALFIVVALGLTFAFWGIAAYRDAYDGRPWSEVPSSEWWAGVVLSIVGVAMLVFVARVIRRQLRAEVSRAVVGVVDARTTEAGERREDLATLLFEDGAVREYEVLRPARPLATAATVGVACFREDYVMAFLPLDPPA